MKRILIFLLLVSISIVLHSQEKRTYNIGILLDNSSVEIEKIIKDLQSEIIAVVGEDAIVKFAPQNVLENNFSFEKANQNYEQLINNDTDIILVTGIINNQIIAKQKSLKKPVILFGVYDKDKLIVNKDKLTSKIENFTPIVIVKNQKQDLQTLKELTNFKKVGIIIEKSISDNVTLSETYNPIAQELSIAYELIPYKNTEDIISGISNAVDIDAVYFAGGFLLTADDVKIISNFLIEKKIPSFTSTQTSDVAIGLMATNQSNDNINQFIRRISLSVEAVISGRDFSNMPISLEPEEKLTINLNTAKLIGVPLKYSLIASTNFVGDFNDIPSVKKYSLLEVMQISLDKNLTLKSSEQNTYLAAQDVKTAKSDFIPNITAFASGNYVDPELAKVANGQNPEMSASGTVALSQTIFSESSIANISIQKSLEKSQQEWFNNDQLDAVYNASMAYFDCLILKANLQIQNKNLEVTKKNLQVAEQNFEAGQSGKRDVLRFQSEMAQNTQSLVVAISILKQAYNALNKQLNNPIDSQIDIEEAELNEGVFENYDYNRINQFLDDPTLRKPFINFLIKEALANAPDLKALAYNMEATDRAVKLYGIGRIAPKLALRGQYNHEFSRSGYGTDYPLGFGQIPDSYYTVGLSLSIPIVEQNRQNINKQTALIQKDQLSFNIEDSKLTLEKNMNDAVLNLINQISNIELSDISQITAKESLDLTQTSYENGAVNIVELLDSQNNYITSELNKINAIYNYLLATITIQRLIGEFHLLNTDAENQEFIQRFMESLTTTN